MNSSTKVIPKVLFRERYSFCWLKYFKYFSCVLMHLIVIVDSFWLSKGQWHRYSLFLHYTVIIHFSIFCHDALFNILLCSILLMCICRGLHLVAVVAVLVQGLLVEVSSKEDWRNWVQDGKGRDWEILNVLKCAKLLHWCYVFFGCWEMLLVRYVLMLFMWAT